MAHWWELKYPGESVTGISWWCLSKAVHWHGKFQVDPIQSLTHNSEVNLMSRDPAEPPSDFCDLVSFHERILFGYLLPASLLVIEGAFVCICITVH